jgi:hypothetical protein
MVSSPKVVYVLWTYQIKYLHVSLSLVIRVRVRFMVFNATFSSISVISWLSVLLVEETGEN